MIVPKTNKPPFQADISSLTEGQRDNIESTRYQSDSDNYKITFNNNYERKEESKKLRQEWKQELDERVSQIADHIESGLRGKELADQIRKVK